jgi:hypothetical protein
MLRNAPRTLSPDTLPWDHVCRTVGARPRHGYVDARRDGEANNLIVTLAKAIIACPLIGTDSRNASGEQWCGDLAAARRAIAEAAVGMEQALNDRAVLCDARHPCNVTQLEPPLDFALRVCLPPPPIPPPRAASQPPAPAGVGHGVRICEPFGEPWQQVGTVVSGMPCTTFRLDRIARWFISVRRPGARPLVALPNPAMPVLGVREMSIRRLARAKPVHPDEVRGAGWEYTTVQRWDLLRRANTTLRLRLTRPPPLTNRQQARLLARSKAYEAEFRALLAESESRAAGTPHEAQSLGTCAFVGTNHELNCGAPLGEEIDAHDSVFRANSFQHFDAVADEREQHFDAVADEREQQREQQRERSGVRPVAVGVAAPRHADKSSMRRFRIAARRAGRRTSFRVNCLHANVPLTSMNRRSGSGGGRGENNRSASISSRDLSSTSSTCLVGQNWWAQEWGRESFNNGKTVCCERGPVVRSNYSMDHLRSLVRAGARLAFARSAPSGDPVLDFLRHSSGGSALHTAIALCRQPVSVYGVGLFSAAGALGDKLYAHAYDRRGVGTCVTLERAARAAGQTEEAFLRQRWMTKQRWRDQRLRGEMLMHLLHVLGIIRWRQSQSA